MCGRSADLWEEAPDEEGIMELKKKGTKLKAEGEMGHESNLLVEMDLEKIGPQTLGRYVHRAWVNKDKFDVMNFKFLNKTIFNIYRYVIMNRKLSNPMRRISRSDSDKVKVNKLKNTLLKTTSFIKRPKESILKILDFILIRYVVLCSIFFVTKKKDA